MTYLSIRYSKRTKSSSDPPKDNLTSDLLHFAAGCTKLKQLKYYKDKNPHGICYSQLKFIEMRRCYYKEEICLLIT